jgi:hypothetical protein
MIPLTRFCLMPSGGKNSKGVCLLIAFTLILLSAASAMQRPPNGLKLQILSLRVLDMDESHRLTRDEVWTTPSVIVRLRLSVADTGVYVFSWPRDLAPLGYKVKYTEAGTVWFFYEKSEGKWKATSPGVKPLTDGFEGMWSLLRPGMAVEWEKVDNTTYAGERHAFSIFVKNNDRDEPIEIFSDPYVVPKDLAK